jgi:predicted enzyme related to lactoylglutathione lyase
VAWNEAMVGDFEAGKEFYAKAFDFTYEDMSAEGMKYAVFSVPGGERQAGGVGAVEGGQPPYWAVTFTVEDTDAAVQRVRDAGGQVLTEPFDFEFGRIAIVTGPDAESFGVIAPPAE